MIRYLIMTLLMLSDLRGLGSPGLQMATQPPSQPSGAANDKPSGLAYATLGLGIASWTILPLIGAVVGGILGWIELNHIKAGESPAEGKTVTQIGFWLCVANLVLSVLGTCAGVAIIVLVYGGMAAALGAAGLAGVAGG